MPENILLVDDDEILLWSMERNLRRHFRQQQFFRALNGAEGLERLETIQFAVVVSDMRMPGMDGIQFLMQARERSPNTTRIMLTGNSDLKTAMDAVNDSQIFRFLVKPASTPALTKALEAGLEQYRLVTAEKELLSKTLVGSIKILMDVLGTVNPPALQHASRLRSHVRQMAARLELVDTWQFELAAMLSQIGYMRVPPDILAKRLAGGELSREEQELLTIHFTAGRDMLANIPRLEIIAEMIGEQSRDFYPADYKDDPRKRNVVTLGAQILQTAVEYERKLAQGQPATDALWTMRLAGKYDPLLVNALDNKIGTRTELRP